MMGLLGMAVRWLARHILIFLAVVIALVVVAKGLEAYRAVPAMRGEVAALEQQELLLKKRVREERKSAHAAAAQLGGLEAQALQRRLAQVKAELAAANASQSSRGGFALDAIRGDTGAIASKLGSTFKVRLLRQEEAAINARLRMIARGNRLEQVTEIVRRADARAQTIVARIADIERRHPVLSRGEDVPILRDLRGPWKEVRDLRIELGAVRQRRAQVARLQQAEQAALKASATEYQHLRRAMTEAQPPTAELRQEIERKRAMLSQHWSTTVWRAVRPVLRWAAWIVLLLILVPPAVKAFWFFVVAPATERLRPIVVAGEVRGEVGWLRPGTDDETLRPGSGVSRRVLIRPEEELLIKPEYLQGSMQQARIDSVAVLSWSIPLGSLATGMIGLTRIRVANEQFATLSATQDMFDEVAVIAIPAGAGLVFKPSNLVGVMQPADRPVRIRRLWRLGHASAWLTLQFRFLLFEGPCALVVKGARGVVLEPATSGRRIAGSATMGWSPALRYSLRRSETFFAYLTGKQSLFNDGFQGEGTVVYEEVPHTGSKGGIVGRGLEGLGDGLLKVFGL